eukprot:Em0020g791a
MWSRIQTQLFAAADTATQRKVGPGYETNPYGGILQCDPGSYEESVAPPFREISLYPFRTVYVYLPMTRWLVKFIISKQEFGYMTTPPLEVFISEPAEVDAEVFNLWLKGHTVEEACRLTKSNEPPISKEFDDFHSYLLSEIQGQYRVFQILESYLQLPPTLFGQRLFQLPLTIKRALIERYYEFDEKVVREFLDALEMFEWLFCDLWVNSCRKVRAEMARTRNEFWAKENSLVYACHTLALVYAEHFILLRSCTRCVGSWLPEEKD